VPVSSNLKEFFDMFSSVFACLLSGRYTPDKTFASSKTVNSQSTAWASLKCSQAKS